MTEGQAADLGLCRATTRLATTDVQRQARICDHRWRETLESNLLAPATWVH